MDEIAGIRQTHFIFLVWRCSQPVHPVFSVNLLGKDRSRFRPSGIPIALVGRQKNSLAFPVKEIARCGQAQLGIFLVVAGVREIKRLPDLDEPGIFHAAIFFVRRFGREDRFRAAREVYAVVARGIAEPGRTVGILRAIQHDNLFSLANHRGVEGSRSLP